MSGATSNPFRIRVVSGAGFPAWFTAPKFGGLPRATALGPWEWYRIPNTNLQGVPGREAENFTGSPFRYDATILGPSEARVPGAKYCFGRDPRSQLLDYRGDVLAHAWGQSGGCVREDGSWMLFHGTGHNVSAHNGVLGIRLDADDPTWQCMTPSSLWTDVGSPSAPEGVPDANVYSDPQSYFRTSTGSYGGKFLHTGRSGFRDGRPVGGHSCYRVHYDNVRDRMMLGGGGVSMFGVGGNSQITEWLWSKRDWTPFVNDRSIYGSIPVAGYYYLPVAMDPATGDLYFIGAGGQFWKWDAVARTAAQLATAPERNYNKSDPLVIVPSRGKAYLLTSWTGHSASQRGFTTPGRYALRLNVYDMARNGWATTMTTGAGFYEYVADQGAVSHSYRGMVYEPNLDELIVLDHADVAGARLKRISLSTLGFTSIASVAGTPPGNQWMGGAQNGVMGRFRYLPKLRGCAFMSGANVSVDPTDAGGTVYFVRTS